METEKPIESQAPSAPDSPPPPPSAPTEPVRRTRHERLKQESGNRNYFFNYEPERPTSVDDSLTHEDLMLEFRVRLWGRSQEVFLQERKVKVWKGSYESGTHRSLATMEVIATLRHLLRTVEVEMNMFTARAEHPTPPPKQLPAIASPEPGSVEPSSVSSEFASGIAPGRVPPPEE